MSFDLVEGLQDLRELLAVPDRWTQGEYARSGFMAVPPTDPEADCFCLRGGVERIAARCSPSLFDEAFNGMRAALENTIHKDMISYNDNPHRTHADILALLDATIEAEKRNQARREAEDFARALLS